MQLHTHTHLSKGRTPEGPLTDTRPYKRVTMIMVGLFIAEATTAKLTLSLLLDGSS